MSDIIPWLLAGATSLLSLIGLWKWRSSHSAKVRRDVIIDKAHKRNWELAVRTIRERSKRLAAEKHLEAFTENKEVSNAARNNPPGSTTKRWNAGGGRSGSGGDGKEPGGGASDN